MRNLGLLKRLKRRRATSPEVATPDTALQPRFQGCDQAMVPLSRFSGGVQRKLREGAAVSAEELYQDLQRHGLTATHPSSGGEH